MPRSQRQFAINRQDCCVLPQELFHNGGILALWKVDRAVLPGAAFGVNGGCLYGF